MELAVVVQPGAHPIRRVAVAASALLLLSAAAYVLERDPDGARMAIAAPLYTAGTSGTSAEPTEPEPPPVVVDVDAVIADLTAEEAAASDEDLLRFEDHPSLADWVHPVMGSTELAPSRSTRVFGAHRPVARVRDECGRGHCGVDLGGPRGTPILAVAWGEVRRVRRATDGRSGMYVLVEHPEGAQTAYMHLDSIPEYLQVGDEVEAGEIIGTLGRTGIQESAPHLHFSLALPSGSGMRYADPAPYLERAQVLADAAPR